MREEKHNIYQESKGREGQHTYTHEGIQSKGRTKHSLDIQERKKTAHINRARKGQHTSTQIQSTWGKGNILTDRERAKLRVNEWGKGKTPRVPAFALVLTHICSTICKRAVGQKPGNPCTLTRAFPAFPSPFSSLAPQLKRSHVIYWLADRVDRSIDRRLS